VGRHVLAVVAVFLPAIACAAPPHNVVLFVPDALRAALVDSVNTPAMARLRAEGVNFANSHSLIPSVTTANASVFATGHYLGDTGDFSNGIYSGFALKSGGATVVPNLESDAVLRELSAHFGGSFMNEETIVAAARRAGLSTAVLGKLGPAAIFDLAAFDGAGTLILDDSSGQAEGVPVSQEWLTAFQSARLRPDTPGRGNNGDAGDSEHPGTWIANLRQQQYFLEVAIKVVLPRFKAAGKPFLLVYWSRDPDGTGHNHGDSPDSLQPGVNGPTTLAAVRTADAALAALEQALDYYGLAESTDLIVASDHGQATISKQSATSPSTRTVFENTKPGELPSGFFGIDLLAALRRQDPALRLFDPDSGNAQVDLAHGAHSQRGNALIGHTAASAQVIVAADGGSALVYVPASVTARDARRLARSIVAALLEQDYVSGIFVDSARLGEIPGTLALSDIGLAGGALTPRPALLVGFRSFATGCAEPLLCTAEVADARLQQGQGTHGSFSRADTFNFVAARGPDFRRQYADDLPVSNADIGVTIAHLLQLDLPSRGTLVGRVLSESLVEGLGAAPPAARTRVVVSRPGAHGLQTVLRKQSMGSTEYVDAAGFRGRTVGLESE
jgi:hypothetical protein